MSDEREAVRAALERASALVTLATAVIEASRRQDEVLAAAVQGSCIDLPSRRGDSPLAGMTVLVLEHAGRPSPAAAVVAEQVTARPALQAQLPAATQIHTWLSQAIAAARPAAHGRLRGLFNSRGNREQARAEYARLASLLQSAQTRNHERAFTATLSAAASPRHSETDAAAASRAAAEVLRLRAPSALPFALQAEQLDAVRRFLAVAPAALQHRPPLVAEVERSFTAVQDRMVDKQLREIPTAALKQATGGRVRFKTLSEAGCDTVQDVLVKGSGALAQVHGISETTARQLVAAAQQLRQAVRDDLRFRIDLNRSDRAVTRLIAALFKLRRYDRLLEGRGQDAQDALDLLEPLTALPRDVTRLSLLGRQDPARALGEVRTAVSLLADGGLIRLLSQASPHQAATPTAEQVWDDFERDSAGYYTALAQVVDLQLDEDAAAGHLPAEIVQAVHDQSLDESLLEGRVSLRGYQSFGARYALVQRRTLLGDEMGLGKTVQAIAVMAHLTSGGARHHLVVCPASVLVNWSKEIRRHSALEALVVHGPDRERSWRSWQRRGGVAVTTFGTLPTLPRRATPLPLLVVDEAHYLKNPDAKRAQAMQPLLGAAERVLFLTGTPLENRLGEFQQLVSYLQPDVAKRLSRVDGIASPRRYREELAPVYLRRNQQDVLQELPDLVVTQEWSALAPEQQPGYRRAVAARNFMRMRRVAVTEAPQHSEKLARLKDITAEAAANGHKVIVFSYFHDVLAEVAQLLGGRVVGPLTGSVPATKRQALVEHFSAAPSNAVLLAQITAGGTGMNMQAGSVVVICEPQVKPSLETQAIARAHRMGQLRGVQVHRLLTTDSVDQRMVEILDDKQRLFDEYARGSEVAASSPEAVDVSEKKLAAEVIEIEMERLAISKAEELASRQVAG